MTRSRPVADLPRFNLDKAIVIREPEAAENGYWVGCPSVFLEPDTGRILMTYRERRPRGAGQERGWRCAIAESTDGIHFTDVWSVRKEELEAPSMERFSLSSDPLGGGYLLYLSYVDPEDNRWRIDVCESDTVDGFDVTRRTAVLTAATTGTEGVKDPHTIRVGPATYLFASFAASRDFDAVQRRGAHASADIYATGMTSFPSGLAVSQDGREFDWTADVLSVGHGWDRYQARLTSIVSVGPMFLGCYDGSGSVEENYEEHIGLAGSVDLRHWSSLTPARPWLNLTTDPSVRYADLVEIDGELSMYYERTRPDGAHELALTGALA